MNTAKISAPRPAAQKAGHKKEPPGQRRADTTKRCPLKGNFCAQLLQISQTAARGACGKFPCPVSKTAVFGVLRSFGPAVLDECIRRQKRQPKPGFLLQRAFGRAGQGACGRLPGGALCAMIDRQTRPLLRPRTARANARAAEGRVYLL